MRASSQPSPIGTRHPSGEKASDRPTIGRPAKMPSLPLTTTAAATTTPVPANSAATAKPQVTASAAGALPALTASAMPDGPPSKLTSDGSTASGASRLPMPVGLDHLDVQ